MGRKLDPAKAVGLALIHRRLGGGVATSLQQLWGGGLAVFVNEEVWQGLTEEQRATITKVLDDEAQKSLQMATDSEAALVEELKGNGMTIVTEADGLDLEAFRTSVLAQIKSDFPEYQPYIEQIAAVQ